MVVVKRVALIIVVVAVIELATVIVFAVEVGVFVCLFAFYYCYKHTKLFHLFNAIFFLFVRGELELLAREVKHIDLKHSLLVYIPHNLKLTVV